MAIDLPPVIPPQLAKLEVLERYASGATPYVGIVNGYELRVTGDHHLTDEEMAKIFAAANTPSQAIILMNSLAYRKGHLLVTMQYAPDVSVVYVHAVQGTVRKVEGEGVAEYFEPLTGDSDLTRADFDRVRVMANVRSERAGVDYSAQFVVDENNPADVTLRFEGVPAEDYDPTDLTLKVGNQGSRYVGRYFGDVGLSHEFKNGVKASAAYQTAFTDLGESRGGEDYHRIQLGADRPFASGLYGINVSHVEYTQDLGSAAATGGLPGLVDVLNSVSSALGLGNLGDALLGSSSAGVQSADLDADINSIVLTGEQVLASDLDYRFNLFQRIDYIDSQIDVSRTGVVDPDSPNEFALQDEKYGVVEVGVKYFGAKALEDKLMRWSAQFAVAAGVTGDSGTLGTYKEFREEALKENPAADVPEVAPAARTAEFIALKPKVSLKIPTSPDGSINGSFVGQFADEQLPQQQQWVLGGMTTLAAYLPGVLVGDSGYFGLVNYEHVFPTDVAKITGSVFAEYGTAWYENVSGSLGDERSIADAGVRVRAEFGWDVTVDAVAARKIADDGFEDEDDLDELEADFYLTLKKVF